MSVPLTTIASMFDQPYSPAAAAAVLDRVRDATRAESQAAAERLIAIAELYMERIKQFDGRDHWILDVHEAVAAEVAAVLRVSLGMGRSYVRYAMAMNLRLPLVGRVFEAGDINYKLFQTIVWRTHLITDRDALATVDAQIAARAPRWPSMTRKKLSARIDKIVAKVDRDAVRRGKDMSFDRYVRYEEGDSGLGDLTARLFDTCGKGFVKRLDELGGTVCDADPRSADQRRADAIDALVAGADRLTCACGDDACPAWAEGRPPGVTVIHVVAEEATLEGRSDAPAWVADSDALISAEVLRELAVAAQRLPIIGPVNCPAEQHYSPSRTLADFVRCRDLTCRAPGCDHPAQYCDLDHTIPYHQGGPTHASNLKALCRKHHLLKTFWGWHDEQLADGTVIWTLPDGRKYVTTPGSALLFPSLCAPTDVAPRERRAPAKAACTDRTAMMPRRTKTRAQSTAQAIAHERQANRKRREARMDSLFPKAALGDPDENPPPF